MLLGDKTQTKVENVIQCPTCQERGVIQNLCKLLPIGIEVRRIETTGFSKNKETTIILSKDFEVVCGRCGEVAYRKNG